VEGAARQNGAAVCGARCGSSVSGPVRCGRAVPHDVGERVGPSEQTGAQV